jgi:hypothetical protein
MLPVLPRLTEKQFMASVFKLAETFGWRFYHTFDSRRSASGFPDAVFLRRPRILFVEFKSDRGSLTDAQRAMIEDLRACGQEAYVFRPRDVERLTRLLR